MYSPWFLMGVVRCVGSLPGQDADHQMQQRGFLGWDILLTLSSHKNEDAIWFLKTDPGGGEGIERLAPVERESFNGAALRRPSASNLSSRSHMYSSRSCCKK